MDPDGQLGKLRKRRAVREAESLAPGVADLDG